MGGWLNTLGSIHVMTFSAALELVFRLMMCEMFIIRCKFKEDYQNHMQTMVVFFLCFVVVLT